MAYNCSVYVMENEDLHFYSLMVGTPSDANLSMNITLVDPELNSG
jgi:hypothetical protein